MEKKLGNFESCMMKLKLRPEDCEVWGFKPIHMEHCWCRFSCQNYLMMRNGTLMTYLRNRLLRSQLERGALPRPLIPPVPLVLRNPPDPRQVHSLHLMGTSLKVSVPSACGYTRMLIVEDCKCCRKETDCQEIWALFCLSWTGCDPKKKCHCGGHHHPVLCESKFGDSRDEN